MWQVGQVQEWGFAGKLNEMSQKLYKWNRGTEKHNLLSYSVLRETYIM